MTARTRETSDAVGSNRAPPGRPAHNAEPDSHAIFAVGPHDCRTGAGDRAAMFLDWSALHGFDAGIIGDCLAAIEDNGSFFDLAEFHVPDGQQARANCQPGGARLSDALHASVRPALAKLFDGCDLTPMIDAIKWGPMDAAEMSRPHTVDHGVSKAPEIRMAWRGSASDLVCLAHEVAHAVQLQLSAGSFMRPVARETCAFLGELALIQWARLNDPDLASGLLSVWREENAGYFGDDCGLLRAALTDPTSLYSYQMNYPLARAAAVVMWRAGADSQRLFRAGSAAMDLLPLAKIADIAALTQNYLPPLPLPDADQPTIGAYRALGAIALLDIDFWMGESQRRIGDYYATQLQHLQNRTVFIALDVARRPVGYATWRKAEGDNTVTLTRQAAPFGDHLLLHKALERHLSQQSDVHASHPRSARQEQVAW